MIYDEKQILIRAWTVKEIVNIVLDGKACVDKIFLIGSYAAGQETEWSDLDFLVQLRGMLYPTWTQMNEINDKLDSSRIHVIFGTEEAQASIDKKYNAPFREISLEGVKDVASTHRTVA